MSKLQMVCSHCGSASVAADAAARWSIEKQDWEVSATYDKGASCDVCGGETRLDEITLDEWQKRLTESQDLHSPHLGIEVEIGVEHIGDEDDDKWVATVSESDVGQIFRGSIIWPSPDEAKDAARSWAMHKREEGY